KVFYGLGGGIRQSVTYNDFKRFPIPSPPLKEQQQISNYLDKKTQKIERTSQDARLVIGSVKNV
ncbi:MAG: restriction endonuclease subunit S, partial [Dehalococcoidia bacterium]|nr:restriction endonuclease subunit S [Dehalococcoidia bacterium]